MPITIEWIALKGEGAYGKVWHARLIRDGETPVQEVAIKCIPHKSRTQEETAKEAQALSRLQHPYIITYHCYSTTPEKTYIMTDLMDTNLHDYLRDDHYGYTEKAFFQRAQELLSAVRYLHAEGFVHCDLKPSNILVKEGILKLSDFGEVCAKDHVWEKDCCPTTRWYKAPELIFGQGKATPAIDIWALGCVFAQMITRRTLFPGDCDMDQIYLIVNQRGKPLPNTYLTTLPGYPLWAQLNPNPITAASRIISFCPDTTNTLLEGMLQLDPTERWTADRALAFIASLKING